MNHGVLHNKYLRTSVREAYGKSFSALPEKFLSVNLAVSDFCINTHICAGYATRVNLFIFTKIYKGTETLFHEFRVPLPFCPPLLPPVPRRPDWHACRWGIMFPPLAAYTCAVQSPLYGHGLILMMKQYN